jgi:hypothetical protein
MTRITILLNTDKAAGNQMTSLLQRGFLLPINAPLSIRDVLTALPGFTPEYIDTRVQTIFVNSLAVDDTSNILIPGDTLALSAAMPGLAGAIFRRGGRHASLRTRPISGRLNIPSDQPGRITVKLFNMIAVETGPVLLQSGIIVQGAVLASFFQRQHERILPFIRHALLEDSSIDPVKLAASFKPNDSIFLTIHRSQHHPEK